MTISLSMIVRDEEADLPGCLNSTAGMVDEIVIVDTGSTDRTMEIARRYTDKVYRFTWDDDFSTARNIAIAKCRGQWILSLDADERLDCTGGNLRSLASGANDCMAYLIPLRSRTGAFPGDYQQYPVLRLFRNLAKHRFFGQVHEQVAIDDPEAVAIAGHPVIWHQPSDASERRRRHHRNLALLRRAAAADTSVPHHQYYMGVEWLGLDRADLACPYLEGARASLTGLHGTFRAAVIRHLLSCLRTLGRQDDAVRICLEEKSNFPDYADLFFDGGILFEEQADFESAANWFQKAVHCGHPSVDYIHTYGAENFLSLFHLGYCREKLGDRTSARNCYRQSLAANPDYVHPIYNLFLLDLAERGARDAFTGYREAGHLNHYSQQKALAGLFFEAGWPDLARACFREAPETVHAGHETGDLQTTNTLARYCLYAGRPQEALALLRDSARCPGGKVDLETSVDEAVSLIIGGKQQIARQRALNTWRRTEGRSTAIALLNLISFYGGGHSLIRPEPGRERAVAVTVLTIIEHCLRCPGTQSGITAARNAWALHKLCRCGIDYLERLSDRSCLMLASHFQAKADALQKLLAYKYLT